VEVQFIQEFGHWSVVETATININSFVIDLTGKESVDEKSLI
jgi:hypothetical protein